MPVFIQVYRYEFLHAEFILTINTKNLVVSYAEWYEKQ